MEPKKIAKFMAIAGIVTLIAGIIAYKAMESIDYTHSKDSTHQAE